MENRILYAILRECLSLVERGIVSEADMDTCVKWGIGYKLAVIGPMRLLDLAGLDIYSSVASYLNPDLSASKEVPGMIREKADAGQLGMKTLGGVYPYTAEQVAERRAEIAKGLIAVRKTALGSGRCCGHRVTGEADAVHPASPGFGRAGFRACSPTWAMTGPPTAAAPSCCWP